ncbi:hypothetical protein BGZ47_003470 [Haplosporangium gracile]|nr:hypothetical protein BGZ47_003470 [Haplosporangium gracile]
MVKLDPKKTKHASLASSTSGFNPLAEGSRKAGKAAKAFLTSGTAATEISDEETTPTAHPAMTIVLPGQESPDPEAMEIDNEDCSAPQPSPTLPDFKKRIPSVVSWSPTPPLSVPVIEKTDDELLAEAKARLDELQLNRRQADRLQVQMSLHLGKAGPDEYEARLMDMQNMTRQCDELEQKYQVSKAAYERLLRHSIVPVLQSASSGVSTATTSYERNDRDVHIKILSNWPTFNGKDAMSAYTFFDQFERNVVPVLAKGAFEKDGHIYLAQLVQDDACQEALQRAFKKTHNPKQREEAVSELLAIGRKKVETYELFARRVRQIFHRLRIVTNDQVVLTLLKGCVTDDEYDRVNLFYQNNALKAGIANPGEEPRTLSDFCAALERMSGPKNAKDYKDVKDHVSGSKSKPPTSEKSNRKQFCKRCDKMVFHSTEEHVDCRYCRKAGHKEADCHARKKDQEGQRFPDRRTSDRERSPSRDSKRTRGDDRYAPYSSDSYRPDRTRDNRNKGGRSKN